MQSCQTAFIESIRIGSRMTDDKVKIYNDIQDYCNRYNIPIDNLMDILQDQKVLPMIRGKATEYIVTVVLTKLLGKNWQVQKLNLNAQRGVYDEDISITHSKTGIRLKVEAKNAVRGSFRMGTDRTLIKEPHFRVKCHKSRSTISKSTTTNDRYRGFFYHSLKNPATKPIPLNIITGCVLHFQMQTRAIIGVRRCQSLIQFHTQTRPARR